MNNIRIIDNSIPKKIFSNLQNIIFSDGFPWFYSGTTLGQTTLDENIFDFSFFHNAYYHDSGYSFIGEKLEIVLSSFLSSIDEQYDKFLRIRIGLIPCTENTIVHLPHIDFSFPHKTGLLYLNTTDGDTIVYDEKYDLKNNKTEFDQYVRSKKNKILQCISPEENRIAIFDGLHYHSSSSPTRCNKRAVITFNYAD